MHVFLLFPGMFRVSLFSSLHMSRYMSLRVSLRVSVSDQVCITYNASLYICAFTSPRMFIGTGISLVYVVCSCARICLVYDPAFHCICHCIVCFLYVSLIVSRNLSLCASFCYASSRSCARYYTSEPLFMLQRVCSSACMFLYASYFGPHV